MQLVLKLATIPVARKAESKNRDSLFIVESRKNVSDMAKQNKETTNNIRSLVETNVSVLTFLVRVIVKPVKTV